MTLAMNRPSFPIGIFFFVFVILAAIAIGSYLMAEDTSHAFQRHGEEADLGRQCIGKGTLYYNPTTKRYGNVCYLDLLGYFGIWISEQGQEVTSFVKNKMHKFEQVDKYMRNAGYTPCGEIGFICP